MSFTYVKERSTYSYAIQYGNNSLIWLYNKSEIEGGLHVLPKFYTYWQNIKKEVV